MRLLIAAALLAFPIAAHGADRAPATGTLIDNVDGVTLDENGAVVRFDGLLIDDDGAIREVYAARDKRPRKVAYRLDGKGRVLMPGMIDSHVDVMALGLSLLLADGGDAARESSPDGKPRPEDRDVAFAKAQDLLLARGITAVADMGTTIESWQAYRRAGDSGRLRIRVVAYAGGVENMALIGGPGPTPWLYQGRLKQAGVLLSPEASASNRAMSDDRLRNLMSRGAIDNFQVAVDARGEAAVSATLDAVAELAPTYKGDRRWRIEGIGALLPQDAIRLAQTGTIASLSPRDPAGGGVAPAILAHGGAAVFAVGGTNGETPDPLSAMAAALTGADGIAPEQALAGLTVNGARAMFAEARLGRIARGLRADFLFVSADPLLASTARPSEIRVLETWIDGRKVYDAARQRPEPSPPAKGESLGR